MNSNEFCAWLEGYLLGIGIEDSKFLVIREKLKTVNGNQNLLNPYRQHNPNEIFGPAPYKVTY
jgi:hypothetical protein